MDAEKINILVVDDLPEKRLVYEAILGELGENVVSVGSGPEALRQLLHKDFAVILLDVDMPGMDGFETAELIRSRKKSQHIPIIFITAYADEMLSSRGYSYGAVDYLLSPVAPNVLRSKVKVFVELSRMQRQIQKQAEERVALAEVLGYTVDPQPVLAGARDDSALSTTAAPRPMRVLIAEDTPANQKVVEIVLEARGHQTVVAGDGDQALQLVKEQDFDLVLMDVEMPCMDGLSATAAIRSLPDRRRAKVPIVAMTAHAMKGDRERCLAAGMNAYLTKPVNHHSLIRLVESLGDLAPPSAPSTPPADLPTMSGAETPADAFELDRAVVNCFGQYNLFQQMAEYLFEEVEQVRAEFAAGKQSGDAGRISKAAHRLKGTLFYLAAGPSLELATRIEKQGLTGDLAGSLEAIPALEEQLSQLKSALAGYRPGTDERGMGNAK